MNKALLIIDYTNDFVAEDGALTCGEPARNIESRITSLCQKFVEEQQFVILAVDIHEPEDVFHPETTLFPPHNLRGSQGRELFGALQKVYLAHKDEPYVYWMDKTRYSAFAGTDLEIRLRARGIEELHIVGVATSICVLHTAIDAYNKGFSMTIHSDAIADFDAKGHLWAIQHFRQVLGGTVVQD
ncbi:isochorismatase [Paenibacillus selenitireducens]|uniref:Isochorismatase n=1 Tax=Paenibacillus selenitireducens TaxID=1324314 RepID=A0A1T2WZI6_9BACL|nr:isochorismatase family cysteine hydrolase [Paenibacillus selenitireducens]OPA72886.1 isochorismatase [Paenibacillus selenitireducens]